MTLLNDADAIRLGAQAASRVYAGPTKVWEVIPPLLWGATGTFNTILPGSVDVKGNPSGEWGSTRGSISRTTGKWYWEIEAIALPGGTDGIALGILDGFTPAGSGMDTSMTKYGSGTRGGDGWWFGDAGGVFVENTKDKWAALVVATRMGLAADLDTGKLFYARDNVWIGTSNPVTGASPRFTWAGTGLGRTYFPAVFLSQNTTRIHGGKTLKYAPPTGYAKWDGSR